MQSKLYFEYENEEYIADVDIDVALVQEEFGVSEEREITEIIQVVKNDREGAIVHRIPEDMKDIIYSSAWKVDIDYPEPYEYDTLAEYRGER